jgi:hypothetical protein
MNSLSLEQLQILERKEVYQFNTERLFPFLYKIDRKSALKIANFKGLNKRGRLRKVWQKAFSAYQKEHPSEFDRHYERLLEINKAMEQKRKEQMSF